MNKQIDWQILTYLKTYRSSLVLMADHERKLCHFCFKGICEPNANNCRKVFDLVCSSIVRQRRMIKSTKVLKQVYEGNFLLMCYCKLVKNTFK